MIRLLSYSLSFCIVLSLITCEKDEIELLADVELSEDVSGPLSLTLNQSSFGNIGTFSKSCRDTDKYFQGGFTGLGYDFTTYNLDLACLATGATVTIDVEALDVPNRFVIKHNGTFLAQTQWIGSSKCNGP